jgi:hypothetical protein
LKIDGTVYRNPNIAQAYIDSVPEDHLPVYTIRRGQEVFETTVRLSRSPRNIITALCLVAIMALIGLTGAFSSLG